MKTWRQKNCGPSGGSSRALLVGALVAQSPIFRGFVLGDRFDISFCFVLLLLSLLRFLSFLRTQPSGHDETYIMASIHVFNLLVFRSLQDFKVPRVDVTERDLGSAGMEGEALCPAA